MEGHAGVHARVSRIRWATNRQNCTPLAKFKSWKFVLIVVRRYRYSVWATPSLCEVHRYQTNHIIYMYGRPFWTANKTSTLKRFKLLYCLLQRAVRLSVDQIISVRHVRGGVGRLLQRPATARGHRPARRSRHAGLAVRAHPVDGRFRGLGIDRVPDHQWNSKVQVVHAHHVDASESPAERLIVILLYCRGPLKGIIIYIPRTLLQSAPAEWLQEIRGQLPRPYNLNYRKS